MTQEPPQNQGGHPGRATPQHVAHALSALRKVAGQENYSSIALPRLATGVGNLEWDEVYPLIQKHLGDLAIPVYVYSTFQKGVAAREPGILSK